MADPINADPNARNAGGPGGDGSNEMVPKAQLDAAVQELKELRAKKTPEQVAPVDVDSKIAAALQANRQEEADKNWQKAQDGFVAKHKEFHPDNDTGGLKKAALDRELQLLNRNGINSVEDLTVVLEKARVLATANIRPDVTQIRIDPSIPRSHVDPRSEDPNTLTHQETKVLDVLNKLGIKEWTPAMLLAAKAKDPAFFERTLNQVK